VAAPGLRIWGGIWGQTRILGGQDRIFKRYCYLPMPLSQDFRPPPQEIRPPLRGGGGGIPMNIALGVNILPISLPFRIFAAPPIYSMWFIQIISWYVHLISALHAWEFNSAKIKLFCLFWNVLLQYWQVLPFRDLQTNIETVKTVSCIRAFTNE
jgi:hypothetical protein